MKKFPENVNWKEFLSYPFVADFIKNGDEELFRDTIRSFIEGDAEFRKRTGIKSQLSGENIEYIINYLKKYKKGISRRQLLKGTAAAVLAYYIGSAAGKKQIGPHSDAGTALAIKGVNYDIGTRYTPSFVTRQELNTEMMKREIHVIKNQLNCNAVRIYGEDIQKMAECSKIALSCGLQVWLSPRAINLAPAETLEYVKHCAAEAERLRDGGNNIVFVVGNEMTMDMKGIINGQTYQERGSNLAKSSAIAKIKNLFGASNFNVQLNEFLGKIMADVRGIFKGKVAYAACIWEEVEWRLFDIVGINAYKNITNWWKYESELNNLKRFNKPIAILEFGCGSYKGAEKQAGFGWTLVDWSKQRPQIKGTHIRDEGVQADISGICLVCTKKKALMPHLYILLLKRTTLMMKSQNMTWTWLALT